LADTIELANQKKIEMLKAKEELDKMTNLSK